MQGLGRIHDPDERDQQHLALTILEAEAPTPEPSGIKYWWDNGAWYDQGPTGTCVGHGWAHFCEDSPTTHPKDVVDPFAIYRGACLNDPWADNDNGDTDFGTTVRAGAKYLQSQGVIGEYVWAWDARTAIDWLLAKGPVVIGINWYDSMFDTRPIADRQGQIRQTIEIDPEAEVVGGHCLIINGVNTDARVVRGKNSWGRDWGVEGRFSFSFDTFERLIQEDGEVCMAMEVK